MKKALKMLKQFICIHDLRYSRKACAFDGIILTRKTFCNKCGYKRNIYIRPNPKEIQISMRMKQLIGDWK